MNFEESLWLASLRVIGFLLRMKFYVLILLDNSTHKTLQNSITMVTALLNKNVKTYLSIFSIVI